MKSLAQAGHSVCALSRHAPPAESDVVIHLAGEPVAQRWTPAAKQRIRESRIAGTRDLVDALGRLPRRPEALICASAIGYYGSRGDEILTESSAPGNGFLPEVCKAWEKEAQAAESFGIRVVRVRTGLVLAAAGGALQRMLPPFRMGVGGRLGSGRQWMSWIHLEDLTAMFQFTVESQVRGPLNGVAPQPATNSEFTRELARRLRRPAVFPVPEFALRLLFGEMADVLLASQRVVPAAAQAGGFRFRYPQLAQALEDLLHR
jgi:hypothetical protein